jgi:hypothetical protein
VSFNVHNPMPPCQISMIIEGKESVKWKKQVVKYKHRGGKRVRTTTWKTVTDNKTFIDQRIPCMSFNEQLNPGFKEYPFSVTLPQNLPGSYVQRKDNLFSNDGDFA